MFSCASVRMNELHKSLLQHEFAVLIVPLNTVVRRNQLTAELGFIKNMSVSFNLFLASICRRFISVSRSTTLCLNWCPLLKGVNFDLIFDSTAVHLQSPSSRGDGDQMTCCYMGTSPILVSACAVLLVICDKSAKYTRDLP